MEENKSYLDKDGLLYVKSKIKSQLDKKANTEDIPTNNNELTNGAGYQTASDVETAITNKGYQTSAQVESAITGKGYQTANQVNTAITNALKDITGIDFKIVTTLPSTGVKGTIYLIASSTTQTQNIYDEYIYLTESKKFEKIGTTAVDLSGYVKEENLVAITNAEIDTIFDN